jgi:hypothetical protein
LERQTSIVVANLKIIAIADMNTEESVDDILESMKRKLEQTKLTIEKLPAEYRGLGEKAFAEKIAEILAPAQQRIADAAVTEKKREEDVQ